MFPVEVKISNAVKLIWGGVWGPLQLNVQGLFKLSDNHRGGNCPQPLVIHHGSYTCMEFFNHIIDIDRVWVCHDCVQVVGGDSHTHTHTLTHISHTHMSTHSHTNTHTPTTHTNRYTLKLTVCVCVYVCLCGRVRACVDVCVSVSVVVWVVGVCVYLRECVCLGEQYHKPSHVQSGHLFIAANLAMSQ